MASRPRAVRAKATLPTVTVEKVCENKSRTIFNEAVSPWLVTEWNQHDYGIDAIVEVTRTRSTGNNLYATGKRFAVQLKATKDDLAGLDTVSVRVRPEHIRYWIESTEPVLLVVCHVPSRTLYWRWIDHLLVEELNHRDPTWIGQETLSVVVPTNRVLDQTAQKEIARFVSNFRPSVRCLLAPGTYVDLQARLSVAAAELTSHARAAGFQSVTKRLADLESSVRTSTYVVVLTGPARAGKSTLLNALVGREVSPVGRLPTTSVSIIVTAGAHDEAEVVLVGNERIRGAATATFLEQYATQDKNPDNQKGVRMVVVRLVNELLNRGVAYADAPGLHDPSADIRTVTETALRSAHAILYVLDVSPAKNGGFSISNHHVQDLTQLRGMAERLFIILNKADVLSSAEQEEATGYLERTLRKYGVWDALPIPPIFASAQAGWEWHRAGRNGDSPLRVIEEAIWTHLLRTNSTGIDRLTTAVTELRRAGSDFASLLAARRIGGAEAFRLRESLEACRVRERELVATCRQRIRVEEKFVHNRLTTQNAVLLRRLREQMENVPLDKQLPSTTKIEKELQTQVLQLLADIWLESSARFQNFTSFVSQEVEKSLQQARMATGVPDQVQFLLPRVPALAVDTDSFEEAWTGLFTGSFFGLLMGGTWILVLAAGGWLAGVIIGREQRRKRDITRVIERARTSLNATLDAISVQVREKIRIYIISIERHITDRISVFVHDVEAQLQKLDAPMPPEEQYQLEAYEQAVCGTLTTITAACTQLELGDRNGK